MEPHQKPILVRSSTEKSYKGPSRRRTALRRQKFSVDIEGLKDGDGTCSRDNDEFPHPDENNDMECDNMELSGIESTSTANVNAGEIQEIPEWPVHNAEDPANGRLLGNHKDNENHPSRAEVANNYAHNKQSNLWRKCCFKFNTKPKKSTPRKRRRSCCFAKKKKNLEDDPYGDIYLEKEPFRKRCCRVVVTFVYILLVVVAIIVTYSMVNDLIVSLNNPVRSIHYQTQNIYDAPGIAVFPGGADFLACGHYYNNVVTSKVRLSQLDLVNHTCKFLRLQYEDPHYPGVERDVIILRGPTSFEDREALFIHFSLDDNTRDFFTVSYFVFPGWDIFNASSPSEQVEQLVGFHRYAPTFALSAGLRMWIKLIMSETYLHDDDKHTEFNVEYSVVKHYDKRPQEEQNKKLFFIFYEWKNNIIEKSYLVYTTTAWSFGAGLCGVFLTLHRGIVIAQVSYRRFQKDKQRRSIRKQTIRELRRQRTLELQSSMESRET